MSKYLHSVVDFYLGDDPVPKTGYVVSENNGVAKIRVEYGPAHGLLFDIDIENIVDDSFDGFASEDQKLYSWYDGE